MSCTFKIIINIQNCPKYIKIIITIIWVWFQILSDPVVSCQGTDVKFKWIINVSERQNTYALWCPKVHQLNLHALLEKKQIFFADAFLRHQMFYSFALFDTELYIYVRVADHMDVYIMTKMIVLRFVQWLLWKASHLADMKRDGCWRKGLKLTAILAFIYFFMTFLMDKNWCHCNKCIHWLFNHKQMDSTHHSYTKLLKSTAQLGWSAQTCLYALSEQCTEKTCLFPRLLQIACTFGWQLRLNNVNFLPSLPVTFVLWRPSLEDNKERTLKKESLFST